jgi:hypothetical protein
LDGSFVPFLEAQLFGFVVEANQFVIRLEGLDQLLLYQVIDNSTSRVLATRNEKHSLRGGCEGIAVNVTNKTLSKEWQLDLILYQRPGKLSVVLTLQSEHDRLARVDKGSDRVLVLLTGAFQYPVFDTNTSEVPKANVENRYVVRKRWTPAFLVPFIYCAVECVSGTLDHAPVVV